MVQVLHKNDYFDDFPIVVAKREPQPPFPCHRHQFSELVIVTGGSGLHIIRGNEFPISAGDVFVISDNAPHEYSEMNGLALVNILFDAKELDIASWDLRDLPGYHALFNLEPRYRKQHNFESRLRLNRNDLTVLQRLLDRLDVELNRRKPGFRLLATARFMEMITFLSRAYSTSQISESRELLLIGKAISFIEENYDKDIDLDTLADIAQMSRRSFSRAFRNAMNMSAMDHLIRLRIAKAGNLLKRTDISVTEVAFAVGFGDSNYFARQFRNITGQSPREYRKKAL